MDVVREQGAILKELLAIKGEFGRVKAKIAKPVD